MSERQATWLGDGFCDNGQLGADYDCAKFNRDYGDCSPFPQALLAVDAFSSAGDLAGWAVGTQTGATISHDELHNALRLRGGGFNDGTSYAVYTLSNQAALGNFVSVSAAIKARGLEKSDACSFEVSVDGTSWTTIASLADGEDDSDDDGAMGTAVLISGAPGDDIVLRLKLEASTDAFFDYCFLAGVWVTALETTSTDRKSVV